MLVGAVSFSGSCVTFAKLQELMTTRSVTFPGGPYLFGGSLAVAVALAVGVVVDVRDGSISPLLLVLLALVSLLVGVLFVLPVGGADVPIVISLLNAFTGLTVAASGYVLDNVLLLVAGTLVGASGTILTRLMAAAMGRSLAATLFGAFRARAAVTAGTGEDRPVRSGSAEDVAILLAYARKVIIVPGYGLAVAQAQHTLRELAELLEARGIEVLYGIHPVAGRMPGHMNVLLAEANVPYEALKEMDEVNPEFATTDVALVVGANDVVNPAAKTTPGAPIYGMPILEVAEAQQVVFLKRSMRPGFAGIENELLARPPHDAALRRRQGVAHQGGQQRQDPLSTPVVRRHPAARGGQRGVVVRRGASVRCGTPARRPAGRHPPRRRPTGCGSGCRRSR